MGLKLREHVVTCNILTNTKLLFNKFVTQNRGYKRERFRMEFTFNIDSDE